MADVRIDELTAATGASTADLVAIMQGGITKQAALGMATANALGMWVVNPSAADHSNAATPNSLAWVLAQATAGARIRLPAGAYATSANIAVTLDDVVLEFDPGAVITAAAGLTGALTLAGDRIRLINPVLSGPGTFTHSGANFYSLVRVTGDNCKVLHGTFRNAESVSIFFLGVNGGEAFGNTIIGGSAVSPPDPVGSNNATYGMGIKDSIRVNVHHNKIIPGADGGVVAEGIVATFSGSGFGTDPEGETSAYNRDLRIDHNLIIGCWDHAIYDVAGYRNQITHNTAIAIKNGAIVVAALGPGGSEVSGNHVYNSLAAAPGIWLRDANNCICTDNVIFGSEGDGIRITNATVDGPINNNTVANNHIKDAAAFGIYFNGTGSVGKFASSIEGNKVVNNTIESSGGDGGHGIMFIGTGATGPIRGNKFNGNVLKNIGGSGIAFFGVDHNEVSHNTITNCRLGLSANDGIRLEYSDNNKIHGNIINDTQASPTTVTGIRISDGSVGNVLEGNVVYNSQSVQRILVEENSSIRGEQSVIHIGTLAAGVTVEVPIMVAGGMNGAYIIDLLLVNAANVTQDDTNYAQYTLYEKGVDGTKFNILSRIDTTATGEAGTALAAFVPVSMEAIAPLNSSLRIVPAGRVLSFRKAEGNAGSATTNMVAILRWAEY